ncbi:aminoglycoside phosphotransferase family protein [Actinokineospora soli]|uniref:Aminoglycoside phosphotransferase family protein n=1 Tax=Actinokineospora soli TaxID=1048753 RepID=A0ABW2TMD1_9PSEU
MERVPSSGTENAMYRLGAELAVRLPRRPSAVGSIGLEVEWLPVLASAVPVGVPVPVAVGEPGLGFPFPWSVCRWVDGANPRVEAVPGGLGREVAGVVAALRRVDVAGAPKSYRGEALTSRDRRMREVIAGLGGVLDVDAVTKAWAADVNEYAGAPVWVHGDLSPGNVLIRDGRLAGVIDFGCMGLGDPAVDLIIAWNLLGERESFREALGVDDAMWARGRAWALSIAIMQLSYYTWENNPGLVANSHHVVRQVLDSHGLEPGPVVGVPGAEGVGGPGGRE